jgi:hypothetical protein
MKAGIDFDRLFGEPSVINIDDLKIFRRAALLYDFQPDKDFSDYSEAEIELLKSKSSLKIDGKFTLLDELRTSIIINKIGINNIVNEIKSNNITSDFANTLLKTLQTETIIYKSLSDSELFYLLKINEILPNKINAEIVKSELQRRYFFSFFYKITKNFAGRENELKLISDYVDWLPKQGLKDKTIEFIRNTISWYDKPPLLIQGIGGIGKSTLISKFITEHNNEKNGSILPFVYIDFDLPGFTITEPLSILLESLRQLSIQYSVQKDIFNEISNYISKVIYRRNRSESNRLMSSNLSSRSIVYESIENLINQYSLQLRNINTPVLIVFDSFEEMQYRASRSELDSFFSFIKEISELIPRLRPVFVGRSEISDSLGDFKFDLVTLSEFDYRSATVLLKKFGISDDSICKTIIDNFGGNPLLLQLAADLLKKDPNSVKDFNLIKDKKHEFLINRILNQIHNVEVREIAIPGMLVRRINPEVIQKILAVPCGLGEIDISKAKEIFDELCKEAALISKSHDSDGIVFRQDLRMACEKMILKKYKKESALIQQNAIEFYSLRKSEDEVAEAEYYYHLLKKGEIPYSLTRQVYIRIRTKLESSVIELPEKSRLFINTLMSSRASKTTVKNSSIIEWENYYLSQIKRGLNGELGYLKQLYDEISSRRERSEDPNSTFAVFEALLLQRLNKFSQSNDVIDRKISLLIKEDLIDNQYFEFRFIMAHNLEYMSKYKEALLLCVTTLNEKSTLHNEFLTMKLKFLGMRLAQRCGTKESLTKVNPHYLKQGSDEEFTDTHWIFILNQNSNYLFEDSNVFGTIYKNYKDMLISMQELDRYCWKTLQLNLKDIALTGEFEIVLRDFLYILEAKGSLDVIGNWNRFR